MKIAMLLLIGWLGLLAAPVAMHAASTAPTFAPASTGLDPVGGVATKVIMVAPNGTILLTTDAGLYYSIDGAATWNQGLSGAKLRGLCVNANSDVFYNGWVGTGSANFYKSTNGGQTSVMDPIARNKCTVACVAPNGKIYFGWGWGTEPIYVSSNNGATYSNLPAGTWTPPTGSGQTTTIVTGLNANAAGHLYAGTENWGVFRSTNNGVTWTNLGLDLARVGSADVFEIGFNSHGDIFAAAGTGSGGGVFRSTDNGATWTRVKTGGYHALLITPGDDVYVGGNSGVGTAGLFRSTDNGATWTAVNTGLTDTNLSRLVLDSSGYLYVGTAATGVFKSVNPVTTTIANQTPVVVSNAQATPNPVVNAATSSLSVSALDPDAGPAPLTYTWSKVSGPGTVTFSPNGSGSAGNATATFTASGTYTLQVSITDGVAAATSQIAGLVVTLPSANAAPTVASPASISPTPVSSTTAVLSVLGADDAGEPALTYTWSTSGPAAVVFSANGANAAKNATATFSRAGAYSFTVTLRDSGGLTVTNTAAVTVLQVITTVTVSPATATVSPTATQVFTATGWDQFGRALTAQPAFVWNLSNGGVISGAGLFTAGATTGGPFTVTASSGAKSGTAQVTVAVANPITVSVTSLLFAAPAGTTAPLHQTVVLTNASAAPITVQVSANGSVWLSSNGPVIVPSNGTATLDVSANPTGVNGLLVGGLTLTNSTGGLRPVPVTLSVQSATTTRPRGGCALSASMLPTQSIAGQLLMFLTLMTLLLRLRPAGSR